MTSSTGRLAVGGLRFAKQRLHLGLTYLHTLGVDGVPDAWRYWNAELYDSLSDVDHLRAATEWLRLAQDVSGNGGVSSFFKLGSGWDRAYPETTGYIIPTFLSAGDLLGDDDLHTRAEAMGIWEYSIQTEGGGVLSRLGESTLRVFNTGQVILGWCALHDRGADRLFLDAAIKAGEYLARVQEGDGRWLKDTHSGARTYYARVDWALLRLWSLTDHGLFLEAAARNLRWVLAQQLANGWFANCGFGYSGHPITHVIGYTLRGVLESSVLLAGSAEDELAGELRQAAVLTADALCDAVRRPGVRGIDGMLHEGYAPDWSDAGDASCLTGNVQIAIDLLRLGHETGVEKYAEVAGRIIDATKRTQAVSTPLREIRGALPGSYPAYLGYNPMTYPNWATKFLADALLGRLGGNDHIPVA